MKKTKIFSVAIVILLSTLMTTNIASAWDTVGETFPVQEWEDPHFDKIGEEGTSEWQMGQGSVSGTVIGVSSQYTGHGGYGVIVHIQTSSGVKTVNLGPVTYSCVSDLERAARQGAYINLDFFCCTNPIISSGGIWNIFEFNLELTFPDGVTTNYNQHDMILFLHPMHKNQCDLALKIALGLYSSSNIIRII